MVKAALLALLLPAVLLGAVPFIERPVTDAHGMLNAQQRETVAQALVDLRAQRQVQMAVLLVRSTEGQPIEDYAEQVFQAWKGGEAGRDNGVLLVVARDDRRMRLEVGYGLESLLTDGEARTLLDAQGPKMREGWLEDALLAIVAGVGEQVSRAEPLAPAIEAAPSTVPDFESFRYEDPPAPDARWLVYSMLAVSFVLGGVLAWWGFPAVLVQRTKGGEGTRRKPLSPEDARGIAKGAILVVGAVALCGALAGADGHSAPVAMLGGAVMLALMSTAWHWGRSKRWPLGATLMVTPVMLVSSNQSQLMPETELMVLLGEGFLGLLFAGVPVLGGMFFFYGLVEMLAPRVRWASEVASGERSLNSRPSKNKKRSTRRVRRRAQADAPREAQPGQQALEAAKPQRPSFLKAFFAYRPPPGSGASSSSSSSWSSSSSRSSSPSSSSSSSSSSWKGGGGSSGGGGASSSW